MKWFEIGYDKNDNTPWFGKLKNTGDALLNSNNSFTKYRIHSTSLITVIKSLYKNRNLNQY